jgi:hypothetical protein
VSTVRRSLGRIAYEAWAATKRGAWTVPWERVPDPEAWEAVGAAIATTVITTVQESIGESFARALAEHRPTPTRKRE